MNTPVFRIARWQTPTFEQRAQELAREIARQEAPLIEEWNRRVRANEQRRRMMAKLTAAARFVETPRILKRQAV